MEREERRKLEDLLTLAAAIYHNLNVATEILIDQVRMAGELGKRLGELASNEGSPPSSGQEH